MDKLKMIGYILFRAVMCVVFVILAIIAIIVFTPTASAQQGCAPREMVLERLVSRYGEVRQGVGLGGNSSIIEIFASDETGTWTITVTSVDGVTCVVTSGHFYESLSETLPKPEEKM